MKKIVIALCCIFPIASFAVYNGKPVATPSTSDTTGFVPSIPPMVSIMSGADSASNPESYPTRGFSSYWGGIWPTVHDCAATLIGATPAGVSPAQSYLLTSAHCVTDPGNSLTVDGIYEKKIVVGNSWCTVGSKTLGGKPTCDPKVSNQNFYNVSQILVNSHWLNQDRASSYDFAILVVPAILKDSAGNPIKPAQVATREPVAGSELYVAGWGTTEHDQYSDWKGSGDRMPMQYNSPLYAKLNVLDDSQCVTDINGLNKQVDTNTALDNPQVSVCTGYPKAEFGSSVASACYGDSGGPLFEASNLPSAWGAKTVFTLVGNVSRSPEECYANLVIAKVKSKDSGSTIKSQLPEVLPVPYIFGFPGAVLCQIGSLSNPAWYKSTARVDNPPINTNYQALDALLPNFKPNCVAQ